MQVDTLYMYDPILDTYTNLSTMPEPRWAPLHLGFPALEF